MKEHIYTIPVTDGFTEGGECPFCNMKRAIEKESVEYILGPAYMTDTIRTETDKTGFCEKHANQMYEKQNRLGLALMLHTHLQKINSDIADEKLAVLAEKPKKAIFRKNKETDNSLCLYLNNITNSCYVCNRINDIFKRYTDTFFYMWENEPGMKETVKNSSGFCITHFLTLIEKGQKELSYEEYKKFYKIILELQKKNLKRLEEELEWFINKFDYRYKDAPWKTAEDALIRTVSKLTENKPRKNTKEGKSDDNRRI